MDSAIQIMELQQRTNTKPQWTRLLVWSTLGTTIGAALPAGYCTGVINSPAVHMRAWCQATLLQQYGLELTPVGLDALWALIVSIFLIGGIFGSACAGWAANHFGRRGSFLICGCLLLVGAIGFLCCRWLHSVELLLISRFVAGLGAGVNCLAIYHSEIASVSQRGSLGVCCAVGSCLGIVVAQIVTLQSWLGGEQYWHIALSFYTVFMVICYAPYRYYAESPKWLYVVKQRQEEALSMLIRLRGGNVGLEHEIQAMEQESDIKCRTRSVLEVLRDSRMSLPLVLLCSYMCGPKLVGYSSIIHYSVIIFSSSGFSIKAAGRLNLCVGAISLITSLMSPLLMAKFNRRTLMLLSTFFCAVLIFTFGCLVENITLIPWLFYVVVASIFLFTFFFELALGSIPSFIGAELFELPSCASAISLASQISWALSFLITLLFPLMHSFLGNWMFIIFSMFSALLFLMTKFYLPETRNREVFVVAELVSHGFRSKVL